MTSPSPDQKRIRILVTGFGSFPGAPINPTAALVARLARSRHAVSSGVSIAAQVFATRYEAVDERLPALLARERPDALIMFGVAPRARHIRVERFAHNRISALFPDAGGAKPGRRTIRSGAPDALRGRFSLPPVLAALRATGLPSLVSRDAGRYLCNYAYWRALECAARPGGPQVVLLVHVPPLGTKPRPLGAGRRQLTHADLTRAGEALLIAARVMLRSWRRAAA